MADETKGLNEKELSQIKEVLGQIETEHGTKRAKETKEAIDAAVKPVADEVEGIKAFRVKTEEDIKKISEAQDKIIAQSKTIKLNATDPDSFKSLLAKEMEAKKDAFANYKKNREAISFEMKTVGNIGANSNLSVSGTPAFQHGSALSQPGRTPYELRHIRDLGLRVVPMGAMQDTFVVRDAAGEGAPTAVAAGAAKPQSDRDWVKTVVPITKLAHYYKVPEEYLDDIGWMQDEITGVGVEELLALEDSKILTASSSSTQFAGLNQTFNSTAFDISSSSLYNSVASANNWDALVAAWTQLRVLKSYATGAILHPYDYALMVLAKASTAGQYQFGTNLTDVLGATIMPHTAVTSDKFFLGDFTKVKIGVRKPLSVRIFDQDQDDAIKNLVTIVIEERITMAADRADRIIYGDFSYSRGQLDTSVASV